MQESDIEEIIEKNEILAKKLKTKGIIIMENYMLGH